MPGPSAGGPRARSSQTLFGRPSELILSVVGRRERSGHFWSRQAKRPTFGPDALTLKGVRPKGTPLRQERSPMTDITRTASCPPNIVKGTHAAIHGVLLQNDDGSYSLLSR
jgi:hypothetical protein